MLPATGEMVAADPTLITRSADSLVDVDLADGLDYGRIRVGKAASAPTGIGLRPVTMVLQVDTRRFLDGFVSDAQRTPGH